MPPTFAELGVPESITRALGARDIHQPFEIQAATIADALAGLDVCGRAPTGSGKTLAFGIPVVARTDRSDPRRPQALILAPTRELADQIAAELNTFAGDKRVGVVYGGVGYGNQVKALRRGIDVLVACPGRLEDLIEQGEVALNEVETVVLDEADRMADMGFMPAVRRLLDQTPPDRQTILFSATLDGDIARLTADYQRDPVRHEVGSETPDITAATHLFWEVDRPDRVQLTADAIEALWPAIVFTRTRHGADRLAKQLSRSGIKAAPIHGGRSQSQRTRALKDFTDNRAEALIATDVAARGIHVDGVALVVQFDPPEDHKAYIHRAGRTARAGEAGVVLSLIQPDQKKDTRRMQRRADLDEPITEPDIERLRSIDRPAPRPAPKPEATPSETDQHSGSDKRSGNKHRGGQNRNNRGRKRSEGTARDRNDSQGPKSKAGRGKPKNGQKRRRPDAGTSAEGGDARSTTEHPGREQTGGSAGGRRKNAAGGRSGPKRSSGGGAPGKQRKRSSASSSGAKQGQRGSGTKAGQAAGQGGSSNGGRPNRKARRAHLQRPG